MSPIKKIEIPKRNARLKIASFSRVTLNLIPVTPVPFLGSILVIHQVESIVSCLSFLMLKLVEEGFFIFPHRPSDGIFFPLIGKMETVIFHFDPPLPLLFLTQKRVERGGDPLAKTGQFGIDDHKDNKSTEDYEDSVCHPPHCFTLQEVCGPSLNPNYISALWISQLDWALAPIRQVPSNRGKGEKLQQIQLKSSGSS